MTSAEDATVFEQWCPDGTCYTRVSSAGPTLGIQLEPSIRRLSGSQIAARIIACNDVAYLRGRLEMRRSFEADPGRNSLDGLEIQADLNAALQRLQRFDPEAHQ
ncbi:hypothetical protein [Mycolicibacterium mageritense]|uniref:hypothetical protein n=1 Tax=Mycolicibacterium mageritense TaxID=53462 RepID=UPI0011D35B86|nr:hypothetical protein [Mycolicibacterium mageritense]TXI56293.1 MAG: hypothetical protein E6Q55_29185 [Mycolicibacterium mageritense]